MSAIQRIDAGAADRLVRMPEVLARTSLSRATIYRKMASGEFPRSIQIGANSMAWRERDFEHWLASPMCWHQQPKTP